MVIIIIFSPPFWMLSNVTSNTCHIFVAAGYKEITSADDPGSTPGLISSSCQPAVRSDDPRGGVGLIYPSSEQRRKDFSQGKLSLRRCCYFPPNHMSLLCNNENIFNTDYSQPHCLGVYLTLMLNNPNLTKTKKIAMFNVFNTKYH